MKKALITGITGQDGAYLAEFLMKKEYEVHGIKRRSSSFNTARVDHLYKDPHEPDVQFFMHYGDLTDATNLIRIIQDIQPDEIYNLAAQSHVKVSFETPEYTANADALGTLRLLEAIRMLGLEEKTKFYQASTSELFGSAAAPQSEITPFQPQSPYAAAKLYAFWVTRNYSKGYGLFACNGILFNHESPRRGETFVTRKITMAVARIKAGLQKKLYLGNLEAKRDWGYAPEYVEAMWSMLQQEEPHDIVIGTGEAHTVQDFVEEAFGYVDLNYKDYVEIDPRYFRPTEVNHLEADPAKAKRILKWNPKVRYYDLVRIMMDADLELIGLESPGDGKKIVEDKFDDWHNWEDQIVSMGR